MKLCALTFYSSRSSTGDPGATSILDELEVLLEEKETELRELNAFRVSLSEEFNSQLGLRYVLE